MGFALLVAILALLCHGTSRVDAGTVVALAVERPDRPMTWNTKIGVVNALALIVLIVALHHSTRPAKPDAAAIAAALGPVWTTLVPVARMRADVAIAGAHALAVTVPRAAAMLWGTLHAGELAPGGGNEIAAGDWIALVSARRPVGGHLRARRRRARPPRQRR
jgi:hypothetical protein